MDRKNNKRSNGLNWFGGLLLLLAFLFILVSLSANKGMQEAQAALEADGRPMTLKELVPTEIPEEHNAAIELESAVQQLKDEAIGESDLFSQLRDAAMELLRDDPDPGALDEFRRLFVSGAVAEALALIENGILKEGYRNDLDLSQGAALKLPHITDLIGLARILAATVQLQAADGDQADAWNTALTSLRLANVLEDEPLLISQIVRTASIKMAIESIRSLDYSAAPAGHFSEIEGLLASMYDPAPFVAAVDGERLMGEQYFHASGSEMAQMINSSGDLSLNIVMGAYQIIPPLRQMDRAAHSNALREFAEAMADPFSPSDLELNQRIGNDIPSYSVISRLTVPSIGAIKDGMTNMFAEVNITRAGLAVLEYQRQHGTYPRDLASLGMENLIDPFTSEPLYYRADDTGFTIYSVGSNLTDDTVGFPPGGLEDINWRHLEPGASP
jgi:hypothetical protein